MNIDPQLIPTTLDAAHLGLAVLAFLLLIAWLSKGNKPQQKDSQTLQSNEQATEHSGQQADQPRQSAPAAEYRDASPTAALQLLTLLQQEARFIDFVNEDLAGHTDAEIGAVARIVHEGAGKTIKEYFRLEPIRSEQEESRVTVAEGFNAAEVRLTGNVVGSAPFNGTLVHRGWKAIDVKLPQLASGHDASVIAAAEVEL